MSAWKTLLEAMQQMPPPTPGSEKRPPRSYLPGVHRPDSPLRPAKGLRKEGPMPTMPAPGATSMPQPSTGEEEQDEGRTNWSKVHQKRNIERWGSASGRQNNADELERSMRAMKAAAAGPAPERPMSPEQRKRAELMRAMIPQGKDVPGQQNPLFSPPKPAPAARPASGWERLLDPDEGMGSDSDEEEPGS